MLVARITAAILPNGRAHQEAVTAALLHDIGKLLIVGDENGRWSDVNELAQARGIAPHEIERELTGVTHAEIGGHLLSLWGLPDGIVEPVALHHDPQPTAGTRLDPVAVVHIADGLSHEVAPATDASPPPAGIDEDLLEDLGLLSRLDSWRRAARELADATAAEESFSTRTRTIPTCVVFP